MLLMKKPVTFRPARAIEAAAIIRLLKSNGLPVSDISAAVLSGFLLAEGAAAFFAALGFREIERQSAPAEITATMQFEQLCPSSAICMVKELE